MCLTLKMLQIKIINPVKQPENRLYQQVILVLKKQLCKNN